LLLLLFLQPEQQVAVFTQVNATVVAAATILNTASYCLLLATVLDTADTIFTTTTCHSLYSICCWFFGPIVVQ